MDRLSAQISPGKIPESSRIGHINRNRKIIARRRNGTPPSHQHGDKRVVSLLAIRIIAGLQADNDIREEIRHDSAPKKPYK